MGPQLRLCKDASLPLIKELDYYIPALLRLPHNIHTSLSEVNRSIPTTITGWNYL